MEYKGRNIVGAVHNGCTEKEICFWRQILPDATNIDWNEFMSYAIHYK